MSLFSTRLHQSRRQRSAHLLRQARRSHALVRRLSVASSKSYQHRPPVASLPPQEEKILRDIVDRLLSRISREAPIAERSELAIALGTGVLAGC